MAKYASNIQIPNLPVAVSLTGTEQVEIVQAGVSCRTTTADIAALNSNQIVSSVGSAYTVATLPLPGIAGRRAWVTDALLPTWGGALTGGGLSVVPVFDNGTIWVSA